MIYVPMVIALLSWTDALAGAKTYGATKPYTYDQQIRRGERKQVKMTVARRVYTVSYTHLTLPTKRIV